MCCWCEVVLEVKGKNIVREQSGGKVVTPVFFWHHFGTEKV